MIHVSSMCCGPDAALLVGPLLCVWPPLLLLSTLVRAREEKAESSGVCSCKQQKQQQHRGCELCQHLCVTLVCECQSHELRHPAHVTTHMTRCLPAAPHHCMKASLLQQVITTRLTTGVHALRIRASHHGPGQQCHANELRTSAAMVINARAGCSSVQ